MFYLGVKPLVYDIIRHHLVLERDGVRLALIPFPATGYGSTVEHRGNSIFPSVFNSIE